MKFLSLYFMAFMAFALVSAVLGMSLPSQEEHETNEDDADWLNLLSQSRFEKRKFGPSDPRSLFNAVYSNYK